MGILIGVFSVAVFTDIRKYRIPNLCILVGMAAGLHMNYQTEGMDGIFGCMNGVLMIFAGFYPFYLMRGIGAGDVKLFMMMACYFQGGRLYRYIFITMLLAAVMSGIKMLCFKESRQRLIYLGRYVRKMAVTGTVDEYRTDITNKKCIIRLSIPAFMGLVTELVWTAVQGGAV